MPGEQESMSPTEFRRRFARREQGFRRFDEWQHSNPFPGSPQAAWHGLALLYELLPTDSRSRPVDASGVRKLHEALSGLSPRSL